VPEEDLIWQDPIPPDYDPIDAPTSPTSRSKILDSGLSVGRAGQGRLGVGVDLSRSDHRGGANGGRIRLEPQRNWEVNEPEELGRVLKAYEDIKSDFDGNAAAERRFRSPTSIVLGGSAAIEKAAKDAGHDIEVPFTPGRTDASQDWTDVESFAVLEPKADGSATICEPTSTIRCRPRSC
jgi:catalase-peroxidase